MKKITPVRRNIRFRSWSRKAYAVFASLGQCVTIGHLKNDVTDCSLSKQQKTSGNICLADSDEDECLFQINAIERECVTDILESLFERTILPLFRITGTVRASVLTVYSYAETRLTNEIQRREQYRMTDIVRVFFISLLHKTEPLLPKTEE